MNMRCLLAIIPVAAIAAWLATPVCSQTAPFVAVRAYPAGLIGAAGVSGVWPGTSGPGRFESGAWAGYNLTRRGDWGEHDDERGGGFGGGIEAAYFPAGRSGGWFAGARAALWRMDIDWRDHPLTPLGPERVGQTSIIVLQPTARAGYRFLNGGRFLLDAEAALGAEFNVHTDGDDVGQGVIGLVGLRLAF